MLYENCCIFGAILGNVLSLYRGQLPLGTAGLAIYGIFAGIFLGGWVIAWGEVVDIYAILARRAGLTRGIPIVIVCMALGKALGSLFYFFKGWAK